MADSTSQEWPVKQATYHLADFIGSRLNWIDLRNYPGHVLEQWHALGPLLQGVIPIVIKLWVSKIVARLFENHGRDDVGRQRAESIGQVDDIPCSLESL